MAKRGRGRPRIEFKPEYCETVIALMSKGASKTEVAATLEISKDTLYKWSGSESPYPDFVAAMEYGTLLSEAWWEKIGRCNLRNKNFNATLWYMNMKNRFKWRDKHEVTAEVGDNLANIISSARKRSIELKKKALKIVG